MMNDVRAALAGLLLLATATAPSLAATSKEGGGYELVVRGGSVISASALIFTRDACHLVTDRKPRTIPLDQIDFYETFRRNLKGGGTNVVMYNTGALMRFEKLEFEQGLVRVRVTDGSELVIPESLINYEGSVREGAMVQIPEGARQGVGVSRVDASAAGGGAYSPPPDEESAVAVPAAGGRPNRRSPSTMQQRRRPGAIPDRPVEAGDEESPPLDEPMPVDAEASDDLTRGGQGNGTPGPRGNFPNQSPGPLFPNNGSNPPGGGSGETGQSVVSISTDHGGPIYGIELVLSYPPNISPVQPVSFTGFASSLLGASNPQVPGQLKITGVTANEVTGPGLFLQVTFTWSDQPPPAQGYRISSAKATDANGAVISGFRATLEVQN